MDLLFQIDAFLKYDVDRQANKIPQINKKFSFINNIQKKIFFYFFPIKFAWRLSATRIANTNFQVNNNKNKHGNVWENNVCNP